MVSPNEQVGRNDPCPCGSGKKNKKCHNVRRSGDLQPTLGNPPKRSLFDDKAVVVRNPKTGQVYAVSDPGITLSGLVTTEGDIDALDGDPKSLVSVVRFDFPAYLPLRSGAVVMFPAPAGNEAWRIQFVQCDATDAHFGLSNPHLKRFTRLDIAVQRIVQQEGAQQPGEPESILRAVLTFLAGPLSKVLGRSIQDLSTVESLPFRVDYFDAQSIPDEARLVARSEFPFTGKITVPDSDDFVEVTDEHVEALNALRADLLSRSLGARQDLARLPFADAVGQIVHDFAYYARQHAGSLGSLREEEIRDLCLIPLKVIFGSAEGEAVHFSGKTDIKVTSPSNRYEFAVVEFKWWKGVDSLDEVFRQLTVDHATGQESLLILGIFSRNKEADAVSSQVLDWIKARREVTALDASVRLYSGIERFYRGSVTLRGRSIPLIVGLCDLFFENPRKNAPV